MIIFFSIFVEIISTQSNNSAKCQMWVNALQTRQVEAEVQELELDEEEDYENRDPKVHRNDIYHLQIYSAFSFRKLNGIKVKKDIRIIINIGR